jgi:hypothetical protein
MLSVTSRLLVVCLLGLIGSGCGKETAYVHSACYDEYVSLVKLTSYSNSLDATIKNVFPSEDAIRTCGSLVDAVAWVNPEELQDLQKSVQEAADSNGYVLCLSAVIEMVGVVDDLPVTVTATISSLDFSNNLLRAASQALPFNEPNGNFSVKDVERFRTQEEDLLEGDRECRRKQLGWTVP